MTLVLTLADAVGASVEMQQLQERKSTCEVLLTLRTLFFLSLSEGGGRSSSRLSHEVVPISQVTTRFSCEFCYSAAVIRPILNLFLEV
jgi:hypothetical protein